MPTLNDFVADEILQFQNAVNASRAHEAWTALERAHILSQPDAWLHTRVHWYMLRYAIDQNDWREVIGQIIRIAVAGIGSLTNRATLGNTGRATVPIMMPMPIPPDLAAKLEQAQR